MMEFAEIHEITALLMLVISIIKNIDNLAHLTSKLFQAWSSIRKAGQRSANQLLGALSTVSRTGGPLHFIYSDLTLEEKQRLNKLLDEHEDKPKAEEKQAVEQFVQTLSEKLQHTVSEHSKHQQDLDQLAAAKAKMLSPEARKLHEQVQVSAKLNSTGSRLESLPYS